MKIYNDIEGVPDFECKEYKEKKTKYCICIPVINEGERIKKELEIAKEYKINEVADIILCDRWFYRWFSK